MEARQRVELTGPNRPIGSNITTPSCTAATNAMSPISLVRNSGPGTRTPTCRTIVWLGRPGGHGGVTTPDPIPNSDVKTSSAYDTASQGAGKSVAARSSKPNIDNTNAGWSSPVARQAHNLKVISSNLIPATTVS